MENRRLRVTALALEFIQTVVDPGDILVDATAGTGQDTLFLAECTGAGGQVYAFDIQKDALEKTRAVLEKNRVKAAVTLVHRSHEDMAEVLKAEGVKDQTVKAIVFNLGYLPGGDSKIVTSKETTLKALNEALLLLAPNGMITVCLYPGHPGGQEEADEVIRWGESLEKPFVAHHFRTLNRKSPPTLVFIQRTR